MKKYLFLTLISLNGYVHAQWESIHGPFGSYINDLSQNDLFIFAATTAGLYKSSDSGVTWKHMPFIDGQRYPCLQFDVMDSLLIADAVEIRQDSSIRKMFKSTNHGESWVEISRPQVPIWVEIGIVDSFIFAFDQRDVWISDINVQDWTQSKINQNAIYPSSFARFGSKIFVGDSAYLYIYEGNDAAWLKSKIPNAESCDFIFSEDSLVLVRDFNKNKLFVSTDLGKSWLNSPGTQWRFDNYFAKIGQTIFATGYEVLYTSVDNGHTWDTKASKGLDLTISLIARDSILLAGYEFAGVFQSSDFGQNFHFASDGMDASYVENIFMMEDQLLTGGNIQGVFNYDLKEKEWRKTYFDEFARAGIFDFEVFDGKLFASNWDGVQRFDPVSELWLEDGPDDFGIYSDLILSPYGLIAGGNYYGIQSQPGVYNLGYWSPFVIQIEGNEVFPYLFAQNAQYRFAGRSKSIARWHSTISGWYWLPQPEERRSILDLIAVDDDIFIIQAGSLPEQTDLFISRENGLSWERADNGIPTNDVYTGVRRLMGIGDYLLCSTDGNKSGIFYSRKDSLQWHSFNEGLPYLSVKDLSTDGQFIYAAVSGQGIWRRNVAELFATKPEEPVDNISFSIYPNPTSDYFFLQLPFEKTTSVFMKIHDLNGKIILAKPISNLNSEIEVSGLPNGLYFLQIKWGEKYYQSKLVIQH
jgi:hypothetical protein